MQEPDMTRGSISARLTIIVFVTNRVDFKCFGLGAISVEFCFYPVGFYLTTSPEYFSILKIIYLNFNERIYVNFIQKRLN